MSLKLMVTNIILLNGNIDFNNNSGNNFNSIMPTDSIIKEVSKLFFFKKPITFFNFSNLCLNIKKII